MTTAPERDPFQQAIVEELLPAVLVRDPNAMFAVLERVAHTDRQWRTILESPPRFAVEFIKVAAARGSVFGTEDVLTFPTVETGRAGEIAMRCVAAAYRGDDADITGAMKAVESWPQKGRTEFFVALVCAVADSYDTARSRGAFPDGDAS